MSFETEHWSSPNGCHEDCPACAEEAEEEHPDPTTREDLAALHRLHRAGPTMLAALRKIVALDSDAHPGLLTWQEARSEAHREAIAAIALTEIPKSTTT